LEEISDRDELSVVSPGTSNHDDAGSDRAVGVRAGKFPTGESLVNAPMGGRNLLTVFTFTTFRDWIRHVLEEELNHQWTIEMNGAGVPDSYATAAG